MIENLIKKLEMRNFEVYYCDTAKEASDKVISLIDKSKTVAWGGSRTLSETGIVDRVRCEGFSVIDRDSAKTLEEREELMRKGLLCGTFLTSTNAISEDGILVNIDGMGNRVAAMCYGPESVIVVAGINKVCPTVEAAEERVHSIAAVKNAERFGLTKTGCSKGECCDCLSDECMCSYVVKTRRSKIRGRIKIVLVGEELGF